MKEARDKTQFIYLMRQKPDGDTIILVDSEEPGSHDYSPHGEVYKNNRSNYSVGLRTK
ncbi:MAG: hypothetical protein GXY48_05475 [Methanomicrobiales archaeon]|nr:hypothetical protein [Methanomicrobiales archaeon]